jgi:hypothetical protein
MAINPIDRIKVLKTARELVQQTRQMLQANMAVLAEQNPDARQQINQLLQPLEDEFVATRQRINTARDQVPVTNADRIAYAQRDEDAAKTNAAALRAGQ